MAKTIHWA